MIKRRSSRIPLDNASSHPAGDTPYTLPEEDPFNIKPLFAQPRRRRSSMLNKWIEEQQRYPAPTSDINEVPIATTSDEAATSSTHGNPYLAYPDMPRTKVQGSFVTLNSYDLMDDDDIPDRIEAELTESPQRLQSYATPRSPKFIHTPSSFRSFHLSFRSNSPAPSSPSSSAAIRASTPTRSFFPLRGTGNRNTMKEHVRSSSLGAITIENATLTSPLSSKWRPSVLGYFGGSGSHISTPTSDTYAPSRPSVSSCHTTTSATSATMVQESDASFGTGKVSFDSARGTRRRSRNSFLSAENPMYIGPVCEDEREESRRSHQSIRSKHQSIRIPLGLKAFDPNVETVQHTVTADKEPPGPKVAYASSSKARVSFSLNSNQKKKKKLVISGIPPDNMAKFDGAKRWCESFGEVAQIMRMPNGDLHVHFRSADVADTVCRLRAKVYIAGVGSVNLSWYTGHRQ